MKDPPPIRKGYSSSPKDGDVPDSFPERHATPSDTDTGYGACYGSSTAAPEESKMLFNLRGRNIDHRQMAEANGGSQYPVPTAGTGVQRGFSHDPETPTTFAARNSTALLRGVEKYTEESRSASRDAEIERWTSHLPARHDCQYNHPPIPTHYPSGSSSQIPTSPYPLQSTREPSQMEAKSTHYDGFKGIFGDSEQARGFRKDATRFNRNPYRPPESDHTIAEIDSDRLHHVERIYRAMTRPDAAKDNGGSIAMRRWVHSAYYDSGLVEAYCHKLLDCLIAQATVGFRGWTHNDYVADDRKGEDADKDVSCAERLDNIIRALEEEKTICEDVMNSACQIRMFVNAPKAYANRKQQNRVGNSKRGRTKEPDTVPDTGPSKSRRTNARNSRRGRQATPVATPSQVARYTSNTPEPTPQEQRMRTGYATPPPQLAPSPMVNHHTPRVPSVLRREAFAGPSAQTPSFGHYPVLSMSPPGPHVSNIPRINTMPPPQSSPFLSPPAASYYASPTTPQELFPNIASSSWQSTDNFGPQLYPVHQHLDASNDVYFTQASDWPVVDTSCPQPMSANLFEQNRNASLMFPHSGLEQPSSDADFTSFWAAQHGVQEFPYQNDSECDPKSEP